MTRNSILKYISCGGTLKHLGDSCCEVCNAIIYFVVYIAVNVGNWVLEQGDVMPRLNKRILDAPATKRYLDLTDTTRKWLRYWR